MEIPYIKDLKVSDFHYILPEHRVALYPLAKRDDSKLLVYKPDEPIIHQQFTQLSEFLPSNTLLVLNNSKVVNARLLFKKETGAEIEIFCLYRDHQTSEKFNQTTWYCMVGNAKKWKDEILRKEILLYQALIKLEVRLVEKVEDYYKVEFNWNSNHTFYEILEMFGLVPLPPYIKRHTEVTDRKRYQTVFAKPQGSVAAPTAGLHITDDLLSQIKRKGIQISEVTLHVSGGTFLPMKTDDVNQHDMHVERVLVSVIEIQKYIKQISYQYPITAVGTTACRSLESIYWLGVKVLQGDSIDQLKQWEPYQLRQDISVVKSLEALVEYMNQCQIQTIEFMTQLMIVPGYEFKMVHQLITNFHQPESTLLMLVSAFTQGKWKSIYEEALANDYRFLSYGDGMLLFR